MALPLADRASLQELYASVVRAMSEGVIVRDVDGRVVAHNPSAERILGLTYEQIILRTPRDPAWHVILPDGSPAASEDFPSDITLRTGRPCYHVIMGIYRGAGDVVWVSINTDPVLDEVTGQPYLVVATLTDISKEMQAQRSLEESEQRLRESNARLQELTRRLEERNQEYQTALRQAQSSDVAKSLFLANMSHELRTPLNAVIGFSDLIRKTIDLLGREKLLEYIEDIHVSGNHLLSLVNDVLDVSRLEIGATDAALQSVRLDQLIGDCIRVCRMRADEKSVRIDQPGAAGAVEVFCDPKLIRQVVINVLVNAIKFSPPASAVLITTSITGKKVILEIADQGPGFTADGLAAAFEPFWQERDSLASDNDGVGLGLAIAKRCVEACGGAIVAVNAPQGGALVTITLPRPPSRPAEF
jgi:PAS domain S-box-containing protein